MRADKITRTIEEVRGYYADDGTWFKTEEECQKYEETAKMVVFKMIKDKIVAKTTILDLFGEGEDYADVDIYNVDSVDTVELLNRYVAMNTYDKQVVFTTDMVGKKIILAWNYDHDWCKCYGTIEDLLGGIKQKYEEKISQN